MKLQEVLALVDNVTYSVATNNTIDKNGYNLPSTVAISIIVTLMMVQIVFGNLLVIIAISTARSLKNVQNGFIASLAVSDILLGVVIMPFSLANELMGYWTFGALWCEVHTALNVFLATASIYNLCLISLDRYWSVTRAVYYHGNRTPVRSATWIVSVWFMSTLISVPPLLRSKRAYTPDEYHPRCRVSFPFQKLCVRLEIEAAHVLSPLPDVGLKCSLTILKFMLSSTHM